MKLVLDIGNTLVKAGVFENKQLVKTMSSDNINIGFIKSINRKNKDISSVILSSVKKVPADLMDFLKKKYDFIEFTHTTPVPVKNLYKTPDTLGKDRLAGVVAASKLYPLQNVLVIDAGTCLTFDFINATGEYLGGAISPGLSMRFKALNTFTGQLPLIPFTNYKEFIGNDTETSILSGVINGLTTEADEIINKYKERYKPLITIICGGDAGFLSERLKNKITTVPELILLGLNEVLDFNV